MSGTHVDPASHAQAHLGRLLARVHVEALMQGNLSAADATELAEAVCEALPGAQMAAAERPVEEVAVLPEGHSLLLRHAGRPCVGKAEQECSEQGLPCTEARWTTHNRIPCAVTHRRCITPW